MQNKALLVFSLLVVGTAESLAQDIPLVYDIEHTGARFPAPVLHQLADLPTVEPLTDPFMWSDGSGRVTNFDQWSRRRAEIKAEFEHYEIGKKPSRPEKITAEYDQGTLTVNVTVDGETLTLTSRISFPEEDGPFPAVIGIFTSTGSLPKDIFTSRKIARITFNFNQVMSHTQRRGKEPINRLYPKSTQMGAYCAWSWGVSRLIDGLEIVKDELPIDLKRLAVTGCSFAGKMALFAGAFDERIALTIAQEPGGGGAAAWRVSQTLGKVETLGATSRAWFMESMFQFSGRNVAKLPMDHHELMTMIAPRALLVLGNPDFTWLAEESGYVSCRAAHEVWKEFGIGDRFGFSIVDGHGHCQLPEEQRPEVEAFVDKFLLGKMNANTNVTISQYDTVDHARWIDWWGKEKPILRKRSTEGIETVAFEAEGASVGSSWEIAKDDQASGGGYITVKQGTQSIEASPSEQASVVSVAFSVEAAGSYSVFARLNCPSGDDDSFWVKMDGGPFSMANGLGTRGWDWVKLDIFRLTPGEHTLTIAYREDGAKLDKISISNDRYAPEGLGAPAQNAIPNRASAVLVSAKVAPKLKDAVGARFKIGVGVSRQVLRNPEDGALIRQHFQILTPENCMKPQGIHPEEDRWNFEATDAFADFTRTNKLEMVGHCLVWAKDDRTDEWMKKEGDDPVSREKLLQRIQTHVETVVGRYADVATHWDVVNEALGDSNDGLLRDSVYSRTVGMDFIVTAFKAARAKDPDALLIYNDYNGHKPEKREKLIELLTQLKAVGAPVDAYGMQGHFELGDNSLAELRETFDELRKLDTKVVVSELDIDVVTRGRWWADGGKYRDELRRFDPYEDGVPAEIEQQMVDQYVSLFQLFDEYSDIIDRVSFWNLHDGQSWLNSFPWKRVNHPLLFDRNRQPKPAFDAVYELLTKPKNGEANGPTKN